MAFLSGLSRNPMQGMDQSWLQQPQPQQQRRGGFFGQGGTGRNIAGSIGDALMQMGGMQPTFGPQQARQQEMQQRLQMHQMQQEAEQQQWMERQNYENKTRPPDAFTATLMRAGIDPNSEQGRAMYLQHARNQAGSGVQAVAIPQGGQLGIVDRFTGQEVGQGGGASGQDATPTIEEGYQYTPGPGGRANQQNWRPVQGGAAPSNGPGRFRR